MTSGTARRLERLKRAEQERAKRDLCATKRPLHLPMIPAAEWSDGDLAELWRSVDAARAAGAGRPLGWMSTDDLLALRARLPAGGEVRS